MIDQLDALENASWRTSDADRGSFRFSRANGKSGTVYAFDILPSSLRQSGKPLPALRLNVTANG